MKKIISFILGTIVALNLSITVANAAANADTDQAIATILPSNKLIIFFIISLVNY